MKLAQRQQGEVRGGKWTGAAREQTPEPVRSDEQESGMLAASNDREDDPYRGMSDGDMLEF